MPTPVVSHGLVEVAGPGTAALCFFFWHPISHAEDPLGGGQPFEMFEQVRL